MNRSKAFKQKSRIFFDRVADKRYGNSEKLDQTVISISEIPQNAEILDIGCGQGRFLNKLHTEYKKISCVGIDLSSEMIRKAAEKGSAAVKFAVAESDALPFKNHCFDRIFCLNSFHHFDEPEKAVRQMMRVLKVDGQIIIGEIRLPSLVRKIVNLILPFTGKGDYRIYSKISIINLFSQFCREEPLFIRVNPFLFVIRFRRYAEVSE